MVKSILNGTLRLISYTKYTFEDSYKEYLYENYAKLKPTTCKIIAHTNNAEIILEHDCIDIVIDSDNLCIKDIELIKLYHNHSEYYRIDRESIEIHNMTYHNGLSKVIVLPNIIAASGDKLIVHFNQNVFKKIKKQFNDSYSGNITKSIFDLISKYDGDIPFSFNIMHKRINMSYLISYSFKTINTLSAKVINGEYTTTIPKCMLAAKYINFAFYKNGNIVPAFMSLIVNCNGNQIIHTANEIDIYQELTESKLNKPIQPGIILTRNPLKNHKTGLIYSIDLKNIIVNIVYIGYGEYDLIAPNFDDPQFHTYSKISEQTLEQQDITMEHVKLTFYTKTPDDYELYLRFS